KIKEERILAHAARKPIREAINLAMNVLGDEFILGTTIDGEKVEGLDYNLVNASLSEFLNLQPPSPYIQKLQTAFKQAMEISAQCQKINSEKTPSGQPVSSKWKENEFAKWMVE